MKIEKGTYLGLGNTTVSLLVRVEEVQGDVFAGHVINGAWDLQYDTLAQSMTIFAPMGRRDDGKTLKSIYCSHTHFQ